MHVQAAHQWQLHTAARSGQSWRVLRFKQLAARDDNHTCIWHVVVVVRHFHSAAGQLCVTRTHPGQPRPYTGVVNIVSGEVAEDLATYLVSSTQFLYFTECSSMSVCVHLDT